MFDYHEKRKIKSWLFSKTAIAVLLIPIVFLSVSVLERYEKERDTREKRAERALELEEIEARAAALEARVEAAESERGIESEIRRRYDVAKEGEQVVVIIDETEEQDATETVPVTTDSEERSFFDTLMFWR